jgi:hypothetical protein
MTGCAQANPEASNPRQLITGRMNPRSSGAFLNSEKTACGSHFFAYFMSVEFLGLPFWCIPGASPGWDAKFSRLAWLTGELRSVLSTA